MGLRLDYSQEVLAQFYATLYVDRYENALHFTLGGKRFSITVSEFAMLFKLRGATTTNQFSSDLVRLDSGDQLEVTKMRFMYDRAYGNINYCHTSELTPYYKMLNLLFRYTFVLVVVILTTFLIELEICFIKWLPVNLSSMLPFPLE
jgi:hypothetical protein